MLCFTYLYNTVKKKGKSQKEMSFFKRAHTHTQTDEGIRNRYGKDVHEVNRDWSLTARISSSILSCMLIDIKHGDLCVQVCRKGKVWKLTEKKEEKGIIILISSPNKSSILFEDDGVVALSKEEKKKILN